MDQQTDKVSYRVARPQLKRKSERTSERASNRFLFQNCRPLYSSRRVAQTWTMGLRSGSVRLCGSDESASLGAARMASRPNLETGIGYVISLIAPHIMTQFDTLNVAFVGTLP